MSVMGDTGAGPSPKGPKEDPGRLMNDVTEMAGVDLEEEANLIIGTDNPEPSRHASQVQVDYKDSFLNMRTLETKVAAAAYRRNLTSVHRDVCLYLVYSAHAHMRNAVEDLCRVKTQRAEQRSDDLPYRITSDPRRQLKALERLEKAAMNRKKEQEKEALLRQAKSRSKAMEKNPDAAAIKQKAKQLKLDEDTRTRRLLSNSTALGAIRGGKNKKSWMTGVGSPLAQARVGNSPLSALSTPQAQAKRDLAEIATLNRKKNRGESLSATETSKLSSLVERRDGIIQENRARGTPSSSRPTTACVTPRPGSGLTRTPSVMHRPSQRITLKDLIFYLENTSYLCKSLTTLKAHNLHCDSEREPQPPQPQPPQ